MFRLVRELTAEAIFAVKLLDNAFAEYRCLVGAGLWPSRSVANNKTNKPSFCFLRSSQRGSASFGPMPRTIPEPRYFTELIRGLSLKMRRVSEEFFD